MLHLCFYLHWNGEKLGNLSLWTVICFGVFFRQRKKAHQNVRLSKVGETWIRVKLIICVRACLMPCLRVNVALNLLEAQTLMQGSHKDAFAFVLLLCLLLHLTTAYGGTSSGRQGSHSSLKTSRAHMPARCVWMCVCDSSHACLCVESVSVGVCLGDSVCQCLLVRKRHARVVCARRAHQAHACANTCSSSFAKTASSKLPAPKRSAPPTPTPPKRPASATPARRASSPRRPLNLSRGGGSPTVKAPFSSQKAAFQGSTQAAATATGGDRSPAAAGSGGGGVSRLGSAVSRGGRPAGAPSSLSSSSSRPIGSKAFGQQEEIRGAGLGG